MTFLVICKVVADKKICVCTKNCFKENETKRKNQMKKIKNQSVNKLKNSICDKNHKLKFRENKNIKKKL